jgi:hypothetical protein
LTAATVNISREPLSLTARSVPTPIPRHGLLLHLFLCCSLQWTELAERPFHVGRYLIGSPIVRISSAMHARTNRRNVVSPKPTASRVTTAGNAQARSRLSNGREVLPDVDGRSLVARRYRDIVCAIASDQGGAEQLSEARLQLIRRFSAACVLAEQMEARLARGEQINIQEYSLLVSTIVRVAQRIGINRVPREVAPSLAEYLKQGAAE